MPALLTLLLSGCATQPRKKLARFEFEQPQMGVPFKIILYARDQNHAEKSAAAAFQQIAELNQIMSDYETDSELSELSRTTGQAVPVSPHLWKVIERAQEIAHETGGAFDISVGPVIGLWRNARREQQLPEPDRLERALQRTGYTNIVLNPKDRTVTLLKKEMRLDLGGIAKGYAADVALDTLRAQGVDRALVAASGDISASGPPPGQKFWQVEIAGYDREGGPPALLVGLRQGSMSTAGDLSQRLEIGGVRYSHIVDPKTGVGLTNHSLVSVVAKEGLEADPIDTALCVLPPDEALRYAEKRGVAARIIQQTTNGLVVKETKEFKKLRERSGQAVRGD